MRQIVPYDDKSQCIDVKSSGYDTDIDRNDIQKLNNEDL